MKKNILFIGAISFIFLTSLSLTSIILPDFKYSEKENRPLKQKPTMTIPTLLDNSYQKEQEAYLKDQFPKRDDWMQIKTAFEKKIGIKKINDVYFGKNNRLIQEATNPTKAVKERKIKNLNTLIKKNDKLKFNFILVPDKIGIYPEETTTIYNELELYQSFTKNFDKNIFNINPFDILKSHKNEAIYYNTDHHWTSLGAKYIAEAFTNTKNREYDIYKANEHFTGTLANRIAYYKEEDTVFLYIPKDDVNYYLTNPDTKKETTSLYDMEKQYSKNPYEIFLGGNTGELEINTTSKSEDKLLLIKDSYANCFVPFILNNYRKIIIVDPRYYFNDLSELIIDEEITDILMLYNMNTFFKDTSFDDLIENTYS